jgi:hypothetical protein
MADCIRHSPQNPDATVARGYIHKSSDPAHNKECGMARPALTIGQVEISIEALDQGVTMPEVPIILGKYLANLVFA